MQINVHNFTLTTGYTATIQITGTDESMMDYPDAVYKALAETEALDLTGFEWNTAAINPDEQTTPNTIKVLLNKA